MDMTTDIYIFLPSSYVKNNNKQKKNQANFDRAISAGLIFSKIRISSAQIEQYFAPCKIAID